VSFGWEGRAAGSRLPELKQSAISIQRAPLQTEQSISSEAIVAQLERVLSSRTFVQSERLCRFLRFVVDQSLQGNESRLKEYLIGVEVFDRDDNFDPRIDSIVRVEARRLRSKLSQYYETEGATDDIFIQFRKGGYAPCFRRRVRQGRRGGRESKRAWRAVVVLPFTWSGPEPDGSAFGSGLAQEIINAVANVRGFRVVARTSAFRYSTRTFDECRLGEDLDADAVVHGTVRSEGSHIRVAVHIVNVWEGLYCWSGNFDFQDVENFSVQEEISQAIVQALRAEMLESRSGEEGAARHAATSGYLRGRRSLECWNGGSVHRAQISFEQTLAATPDHVPSLAGLAEAWCRLTLTGEAKAETARLEAESAALQAVEIDETAPEARVSLGLVNGLLKGDWAAAEQEFRKAIEADPNYAPAYVWLGAQKAACGAVEAGLEELRRAREIDPISIEAELFVGLMLDAGGQRAEAAGAYQSALSYDPDCWLGHWALGWNQLNSGAPFEAIGSFQAARRLAGPLPLVSAAIGCAFLASGQPFLARDVARRQERETEFIAPADRALLLYASGDRDKAAAALEQARSLKDPRLALEGMMPEWSVFAQPVNRQGA
jgi:serine/threonine-protein kinase